MCIYIYIYIYIYIKCGLFYYIISIEIVCLQFLIIIFKKISFKTNLHYSSTSFFCEQLYT